MHSACGWRAAQAQTLLGAEAVFETPPDVDQSALAGQHIHEAAEGLDAVHLDISAQGKNRIHLLG